MENNSTNKTMREEKLSSHDIATEILPLLNDYFCGTFSATDDEIIMAMENGQLFKLKVAEVAE